MKQIRKLTAEDCELRINEEYKDGNAKYFVYINSRTSQTLLDETFGAENWSDSYKVLRDVIYCRLEVFDKESGRTVVREDCGNSGNSKKDKEKAEASDALKRCIVRLGVIELYSAPDIVLPKQYGYTVSKLDVNDDRKIVHMEIVDKNGNTVFNWTLGQSSPTVAPRDNATILKEFCSKMKTQPGVNIDNLKEFFGYWSGRIEKGFNGIIQPEVLWNKKYGNVA